MSRVEVGSEEVGWLRRGLASEEVGFGGGRAQRRSDRRRLGKSENGGGPRESEEEVREAWEKEVGKIGKKEVGKIGKRRLGKWKKGGWENGKKEVGKIAKRRLGKKALENIVFIL